MFAQMCEAVAACHTQHVFHRDIKPENFIVTDGWTTLPDGRQERKVIVKLTDFGLSTTDVASSDMDCGSAPYMSYGMAICTLVVMWCTDDFLQNAEIILPLLIALVLLMSGRSALC
jgi:serine/threonine protein kinase